MDQKGFSVGEALGFAWGAWKKRWGLLTLVAAFAALLPAFPKLLQMALSEQALFAQGLLGIVHYIFMIIANMGFITIALKAARQEEYDFSDFFSKIHLFPSYFLGQVIFFIAVVIGFLLLIIPGIIIGLKFALWPFFVVDRSFKGIEALKASNQAVFGSKWDILLFYLAAFFINLLGILCLGVGLFVTLPVTWIAWAHIYDKLTTPSPIETQT